LKKNLLQRRVQIEARTRELLPVKYFLFPVKAIKLVYRGKYMQGLKHLMATVVVKLSEGVEVNWCPCCGKNTLELVLV
jgi:hypothetical protein